MADSTIPKKDGIWETIKTIFWALLIAGIFRTLFFQPFWIPSGSMKDTLLIGDFLFVNKMAYGYSAHSCPFSVCPISGRLFGSEPERGETREEQDGRGRLRYHCEADVSEGLDRGLADEARGVEPAGHQFVAQVAARSLTDPG